MPAINLTGPLAGITGLDAGNAWLTEVQNSRPFRNMPCTPFSPFTLWVT
jgi:hypothetical protein